jgi:gluconokinase
MSMVALHPFSEAVVVMGVASCGKTTIGAALAAKLNVEFLEGDHLHSSANVAKMSAGIALTDDDRWPWLERVGVMLQGPAGKIASCSALKRSYRTAIVQAAQRPVRFLHLHGSKEVLQNRIGARKGHFMPSSLLESQLATLEIPTADEGAVTLNINQDINDIVFEALHFLVSEKDMT